MCPSLIDIGSKTAEKNFAQTNKQTNKQTNRQTDITKITVTWPWTNSVRHIRLAVDRTSLTQTPYWALPAANGSIAWELTKECVYTEDVRRCIESITNALFEHIALSGHTALATFCLSQTVWSRNASVGYTGCPRDRQVERTTNRFIADWCIAWPNSLSQRNRRESV